MKHLIIILSILLSFTINSCSPYKDSSSSTTTSDTTTTNETTTTDSITNSTWTKQLGTTTSDYGYTVTTDSSGNIYVTGSTYGHLDGNTNSGKSDIFLVKYNSSGTKQWTKQLGSSSDEFGLGVKTDSSGNIYVSGHTYGDLDGNTSSGGIDIFLVKYNSTDTKQ